MYEIWKLYVENKSSYRVRTKVFSSVMTLTFDLLTPRYLTLAILHLWKYESCTLKTTQVIVSEPRCWRKDWRTDGQTNLIPSGRALITRCDTHKVSEIQTKTYKLILYLHKMTVVWNRCQRKAAFDWSMNCQMISSNRRSGCCGNTCWTGACWDCSVLTGWHNLESQHPDGEV